MHVLPAKNLWPLNHLHLALPGLVRQPAPTKFRICSRSTNQPTTQMKNAMLGGQRPISPAGKSVA
jgi:hypothetical protein